MASGVIYTYNLRHLWIKGGHKVSEGADNLIITVCLLYTVQPPAEITYIYASSIDISCLISI